MGGSLSTSAFSTLVSWIVNSMFRLSKTLGRPSSWHRAWVFVVELTKKRSRRHSKVLASWSLGAELQAGNADLVSQCLLASPPEATEPPLWLWHMTSLWGHFVGFSAWFSVRIYMDFMFKFTERMNIISKDLHRLWVQGQPGLGSQGLTPKNKIINKRFTRRQQSSWNVLLCSDVS